MTFWSFGNDTVIQRLVILINDLGVICSEWLSHNSRMWSSEWLVISLPVSLWSCQSDSVILGLVAQSTTSWWLFPEWLCHFGAGLTDHNDFLAIPDDSVILGPITLVTIPLFFPEYLCHFQDQSQWSQPTLSSFQNVFVILRYVTLVRMTSSLPEWLCHLWNLPPRS